MAIIFKVPWKDIFIPKTTSNKTYKGVCELQPCCRNNYVCTVKQIRTPTPFPPTPPPKQKKKVKNKENKLVQITIAFLLRKQKSTHQHQYHIKTLSINLTKSINIFIFLLSFECAKPKALRCKYWTFLTQKELKWHHPASHIMSWSLKFCKFLPLSNLKRGKKVLKSSSRKLQVLNFYFYW